MPNHKEREKGQVNTPGCLEHTVEKLSACPVCARTLVCGIPYIAHSFKMFEVRGERKTPSGNTQTHAISFASPNLGVISSVAPRASEGVRSFIQALRKAVREMQPNKMRAAKMFFFKSGVFFIA